MSSYSERIGPNLPASSPCLLDSLEPEILPRPEPAPSLALLNGLSRVFGIRFDSERGDTPEARFLKELAQLFQPRRVEAEATLEAHDRPWGQVYLIQYGVMRLYREAPTGRIAIHHFFSEGDLVWPVFGRTRTKRNTLCLTAVTNCTVWTANFSAFRAAVSSRGEDTWARFALSLIEELAELTSMREFRKQTMPAKERYHLMLEEYPELVKRVPDNQLAAWLGVVPATFSRLKNGKTN
ncbi:cAMP-binding domain of CRP or a regulatory subunit of cAMP-dependent protein kinases [Marinobacter daqiaonensis]|uniref:cAMP-binding domain of CRP or a regulatory subunit of cAMP-dependent protein kinases n=1 Tax=Marinobacter daqiaonensis TaxID=650891 RepID=A0A1I6HRX8_9GAMM|nr:Crp/Fnr family transcriptional regulator [Marinobacter daqiaonensis]SFR57030.1 cAMP-binding domain of CRP or a regulatory subunit of cAMP-dependent protein kinases [Marinobacter daqiaonensis]